MALKQKRGARPMLTSNQRAKKRQKVDTASASTKKASVQVDDLPWAEVQLPDILDDAEGFYGLEEVEDVDIVRHGDKVQFISRNIQSFHEEEEEFNGFDDAIEVENTEEVTLERSNGEAKSKKNKDDKKKAKSKPPATSDSSTKKLEQRLQPAGNAFDALEIDSGFEDVDVSAWQELELSMETLSALAKLGFTKPTPIQSAAIPEIIAGHDVIGKASTGSGKTLAFAIPILEKWLEGNRNKKTNESTEQTEARTPTALVLSPTRELAHQLTEHITALCNGAPDSPYVIAVTGGLSIQKQQRQLAKADIVIGTPGRLWEVMSSTPGMVKSFKAIKFLVLDEADRLLTEGHFKEAEEILNALNKQEDADDEDEVLVPTRETLVFSATFHKGLQQKLAGKGKHALTDKTESMEYLLKKLKFREEKPRFVDVNPVSQMAEGLKEGVVECAGTEKDLYLYALLMYHPGQRALVFTNSIHSVRRLVSLLQNLNLPVQGLHSQMIQKARMRSVERFSSSKSTGSILIATDVAARGLDIKGIQLVIHYHLPRTADMYVHRSGRTARAEALGSSILLCAPEEVVGVRRLIAKVHAQNALADSSNKSKYYMRSLDLDRKIVARLKPRVTLAKQIADSALAKEKKGLEDDWVRKAAEDLGVEYDSEELEASGRGKGRGNGRKQREKDSRAMTKAEVGALRAELKALLAQRINVGVSERYLTSGGLNINELLKGTRSEFLGNVESIGFEDI